jgi:hypothetical protein
VSYIHRNRGSVYAVKDPIDPDSTDWVFFVYEDWLRLTEVITEHSASIVNGTIETDSVYIGTMMDAAGTTYNEVYGVQFTPDANATEVTVTHRVTTSTVDTVDLARIDIDHTIIIPVETQ